MPSGIYQHKKGYNRPPFSDEWKRKIKEKRALQKNVVPPSLEVRKKAWEANKGRKITPENRIKMVEGIRRKGAWNKGLHKNLNTGRTHFKKGNKPWNKGKKRTDISGKNYWNWKGGISNKNEVIRHSLEYKLWQDSVFNRDCNCCQKCGENKVYKLVAHHILNFSDYIELRFAIDNGIAFCRSCHKLFHRKYGRKNNTKEQLEEFLNNA